MSLTTIVVNNGATGLTTSLHSYKTIVIKDCIRVLFFAHYDHLFGPSGFAKSCTIKFFFSRQFFARSLNELIENRIALDLPHTNPNRVELERFHEPYARRKRRRTEARDFHLTPPPWIKTALFSSRFWPDRLSERHFLPDIGHC